MPERASFYIDGYNLYCGVRDAFGKKWLWLDVGKLCRSILKPDQELVAIHYCTARTRGEQDSWRRQDTYWKALRTIPELTIHEGFHQRNRKWCEGCKDYRYRHEEKQTDSRIASLLVADAMADRADTLIVVGGDSDHVPPVQTVQLERPSKDILLCLPPRRKSKELEKVVGKVVHLSESKLRNNQFPDDVVLADGQIVSRPAEWTSGSK